MKILIAGAEVVKSEDNRGRVEWTNNAVSHVLLPHRIVLPKNEQIYNMFTILHELGHLATQKYSVRRDKKEWHNTNRKNLSEIKAWQYVARCVKKEYYVILLDHAFKCLLTFGMSDKEQIRKYIFDKPYVKNKQIERM